VKTGHLNILSESLGPGFNLENQPNHGPVQSVKELTYFLKIEKREPWSFDVTPQIFFLKQFFQ